MKKNKNTKAASGKNQRFQPHFRKFKNAKFTGHPQFVYDEEGREYKCRALSFFL